MPEREEHAMEHALKGQEKDPNVLNVRYKH
jgi:hypothetical protein